MPWLIFIKVQIFVKSEFRLSALGSGSKKAQFNKFVILSEHSESKNLRILSGTKQCFRAKLLRLAMLAQDDTAF